MSSCRNTDTAVWMSHIWKNIGSSSLWLFFFPKSVQSRGRRETRMSVMREETEFEEEMLQELKSGRWGNQGRLKSKFTVKVETPLIRGIWMKNRGSSKGTMRCELIKNGYKGMTVCIVWSKKTNSNCILSWVFCYIPWLQCLYSWLLGVKVGPSSVSSA